MPGVFPVVVALHFLLLPFFRTEAECNPSVLVQLGGGKYFQAKVPHLHTQNLAHIRRPSPSTFNDTHHNRLAAPPRRQMPQGRNARERKGRQMPTFQNSGRQKWDSTSPCRTNSRQFLDTRQHVRGVFCDYVEEVSRKYSGTI